MSKKKPANENVSLDHSFVGFLLKKPFEDLVKRYKSVFSEKKLEDHLAEFKRDQEAYLIFIKEAQSRIVKYSLLSSFLIYCEEELDSNEFINIPKLIVDKELIQFKNSKGKPLLIEEVNRQDILSTIEKIRCQKDIDVQTREFAISKIINFNNWLSVSTFSYVPMIEDPDKIKTFNRLIEYHTFINLLKFLDERTQVVAKLLYFGGSRTLDQVVKLNIKDINFKHRNIQYDDQVVSYPLHVFEDIKNLIKDSKSERVFSGRKNTSLNPATIFRNFKDAALKAGLDISFSPKSLTTDQ